MDFSRTGRDIVLHVFGEDFSGVHDIIRGKQIFDLVHDHETSIAEFK